jgi:glycosyltransferase involved in cell wall biosynthesis
MVEVSVVVPAMNEEASIGRVVNEVHAALSGRYDYEIVVVDTNSRDRTVAVARRAGARVVNEPRPGYGRAYKTGFAAARGAILATLDADLTYPADRLPEFIELVRRGEADFVSGDRLSRVDGDAMRGMHKVGNRLLTAAFRLLFGYPIRDSQSGMWVLRRALVANLALHSDGMAFSEEIKAEALRRGYRFVERPVAYRVRVGEAKIRSVRDALRNLFYLVRKRFGWTRDPMPP